MDDVGAPILVKAVIPAIIAPQAWLRQVGGASFAREASTTELCGKHAKKGMADLSNQACVLKRERSTEKAVACRTRVEGKLIERRHAKQYHFSNHLVVVC